MGQKLHPAERTAETKTNRNPSPKNLHPVQVSFKNEGEIKMFSDEKANEDHSLQTGLHSKKC